MYELLLNFPDPAITLRENPDFSIQLANEGLWEPGTGYNKLNHILFVDQNYEQETYEGGLKFISLGTYLDTDHVEKSYIPGEIELHQNYPNPFNPTTTISYDLLTAKYVKLEVYNLLGQKMKVLENGFKESGSHQVTFNGDNLSSGIYFYKLRSDNILLSRSMMLIK